MYTNHKDAAIALFSHITDKSNMWKSSMREDWYSSHMCLRSLRVTKDHTGANCSYNLARPMLGWLPNPIPPTQTNPQTGPAVRHLNNHAKTIEKRGRIVLTKTRVAAPARRPSVACVLTPAKDVGGPTLWQLALSDQRTPTISAPLRSGPLLATVTEP